MTPEISNFKHNLINSDLVIERNGEHSEFSSGLHGQKIDFGNIPLQHPLRRQWASVITDNLASLPRLPEIIVSVASGTNGLVYDVAKEFDGKIQPLVSWRDKVETQKLVLQPHAYKIIRAIRPRLLYVLEDVGTTGASALQVVRHAKKAGALDVEVLNTWQRATSLAALNHAHVKYQSLITDIMLPTYTPEDCQRTGLCALGWRLNEYKR